ncbi:MAG TPA: LamG-like jellyroll fold domain-containing protein [Bacteroidales bacterium]|nr:LamG-like jellyroll fold domain-containing protein [Bacteroidales bacterium]
MKTKLLLILFLMAGIRLMAQETIFYEDFGNAGYFRAPANTYPEFSSDSSMFSSDSIAIHNWATEASNYQGASGEGFALCGYPDNNVVNLIVISGINTVNYSNIQLSFGAATWYGIASNYMDVYYSTDGSTWTMVNDDDLASGQYGDASWGYVTLNATLPSVSNLRMKFNVTDQTQTVRFDDITLTGVGVDNTPPDQPTGLQLLYKTYNSIGLTWNPSGDNIGLDHYDIYRDGILLTSVTDNSAELNYLNPGTISDYTVVAVDLVANASPASDPLQVTLDVLPADYKYDWQQQQAIVSPDGNLQWNPKSFVYEEGSSVRYIDFENGDDSNDGQSEATAWKHHPWDQNATGNAAGASGIHTYVFKRGVIYRGVLTAKESGKPGDPIRLTSNPSWGTGEAGIYGSMQFTGGWTQGDATSAPNIPDPTKVWYQDASLPQTNVVVETVGDQMNRIRVARTPNYQDTPDDPLKTWYTWTGKTKDNTNNVLLLTDTKNLTQSNPDYYNGGTVWSQEDAIVMCTVWGQTIMNYDPAKSQVTVKSQDFGGVRSHYYIENTPFLLDTVNEFYYDKAANRLFVRLEGEKDPNTTTLEVATTDELLKINGKHDIVVSGLTFGYTTSNQVRYGYADTRSAIRMGNSCRNIDIKNNRFVYVNAGVSAQNASSENLTSSDINVTDNDFHVVDDLAIIFAENNGVYFRDMKIMRNRIYDTGGRQRGRWYSSIPAIMGQFRDGQAAGNIVDVSWGNGLDFFWGKSSNDNREVPFIRGMIYQNQASNTLIGTNDYGGIESWQGGPAFCFNNVSHNASGFKHYNNQSIGYAYYFDGAFKQIVFNNIASGVSHERNAASIMQVLGFYNIYAQNTAFRTSVFFNGAGNTLALNGYNTYLANIGDDVNTFFSHQIKQDYIPFESYGHNISSTLPFSGSLENKGNKMDIVEFRDDLKSYPAQLSQTGWNSAMPVFGDPANHNFTPKADGEAIDRGVRFFTAFPLSSVVGEWDFYIHPADPSVVMGSNLYMTTEYSARTDYQNVPKNNLTIHNLNDTSFVKGELEDWTTGALWFDGQSTYGSVTDADVRSIKCNNVDMTTNNFIIELYVKPDTSFVNGVLVAKHDNSNGYELGIDDSGMPVMTVYAGGTVSSQSAAVAVNEGGWHHILAEVNRAGAINMYVDGELSNGTLAGSLPDAGSTLGNTSDFLVGKNADGNFFRGTIDFLRVSKGLLSDAKTTIGELYTWETDGPFLYDITGKAPDGQRDAGAIEAGSKPCQMTVDPLKLTFDESSSSQLITIDSYQGFSLYGSTGDFFTTDISDVSVNVTVDENTRAVPRSGDLTIYGCNESQKVTIEQLAAPCMFEVDADTLFFTNEQQSATFEVNTNDEYTIKRSDTFFNIKKVPTGDSVEVSINENTTYTERIGEITLTGCDGPKTIPVIQEPSTTSVFNYLPDGMEVYPNPVSGGLLNLTLPDMNKEYTVVVTDLAGKVLLNEKMQGGRRSVEITTGPGTYMLHISSNEDDVQTKLIVL